MPLSGTIIVHDHSSDAAGGIIPETSIQDGALLARVASGETISGTWAFAGGGGLTVVDQVLTLQGTAGIPQDLVFQNLFGGGSIGVHAAPTTATNIIGLPNQSGDATITGNGGDPPTVAQKIGKVDRAATASAVSTGVKILATAPAGWYEIDYYIICTVAGAGSISVLLTYNDGTARTDVTIGTCDMTSTTLPGFGQGTFRFKLASAGDATWKTKFSSAPVGSGTYKLNMRATYKGPA